MSELRIDKVVTAGVFTLDGGSWEVENNVWLFGDDSEVVIVDAAHDIAPIVDAVANRTVRAIVCTHGHNDHISVAPQLSHACEAPVFLHPADQMLWNQTHGDVSHHDLFDGQKISIAGTELTVINTPGHSPGSCCLHLPEAGELFTGDTLFAGGPGATGRSFSDFGTIIDSIRERLFILDPHTRVRTGHGDTTSLGVESPHLQEWISAHR
ncbi:MAG: MBL fold metallo-hydrolase [Mycobacteriaceae bacterium]